MAEELKSPTQLHNSGIPLILKFILLFLILLLLGVGGFFAYQYFTIQKAVKSEVKLPQEPKSLIEEVGKLIELPVGEEPKIATVSDVTQLNDEQFFASAKNGDKVLIYQKSKKAILYRPATKKIINVGPVNIDASGSATTKETPSVTPKEEKLTVALYNGTKRAGLTKKAETQITEDDESIEVIEKENSKLDYKETVVIDISGKQKAKAAVLAKIVSGKVASFPKGERDTEALILIILGDNYQAP